MRLYRALLRLLPASFRAEYGEEMRAIFARRLRDAPGRSRGLAVARGAPCSTSARARCASTWTSCARTCATLGRCLAPRARLRAHRRGRGPALGVGATTAAFSVTDHVLIRPLPFPEPDRLVELWQSDRAEGYSRRAQPRQLPRLEALEHLVRGDGRVLQAQRQPRRRRRPGAAGVGGRHRTRCCRSSARGRCSAARSRRRGPRGRRRARVLLSDGLWRERFGGDPACSAASCSSTTSPTASIGVMPRGFHFPQPRDARSGCRCGSRRTPSSGATTSSSSAWRGCGAGVSLEAARGRDRARGGAARARSTRRRTRTSARASSGCATSCRSSRGCCCSRCSARRSACC